jgi:hypothetical protein
VKGFVEPSLVSLVLGINFNSNVWVISIRIKIAGKEKVLIKQLDLKTLGKKKGRKKVIY